MLFFVRIPGWVYCWLSYFTCVAISACVSKMIGFGYFPSGWLQYVIMILGCIILVDHAKPNFSKPQRDDIGICGAVIFVGKD